MLNDLISRYPALAPCREALEAALSLLIDTYRRGGKVLLCGNGGSAADCDHLAGELGKSFLLRRPLSEGKRAEMRRRSPGLSDDLLDLLEEGLPAIPLTTMTALLTAYANDKCPTLAFAQGVLALGRLGDTLVAISTSGNSESVLAAARIARGLGISVLALTGEGGGALASLADVLLAVPERRTFAVQELHLPVYHWLAAAVEAHFFGE